MKDVAFVTHDLRRRLREGEWQPGSRMPTFDRLQGQYRHRLTNVYRVREALAPLITEGLIRSDHGSGTWVIKLPLPSAPELDFAAQLDEVLVEIDTLRARVVEIRSAVASAVIL